MRGLVLRLLCAFALVAAAMTCLVAGSVGLGAVLLLAGAALFRAFYRRL